MASKSRFVSLAASGILVAAVSLGVPSPGVAGPFTLESIVEANLGCHFTDDPSTNECVNEEDPFDLGTKIDSQSGAVVTGSWTDAFLVNSLASAEAQYGQLSVSAEAAFDIPLPGDTRFVSASATAVDSISVTGDEFVAGDPGIMEVTLALSGSIVSSDAGFAGATFGVTWDGAQGDDGSFEAIYSSVSQEFVFFVPIIAGEEFTLGYFLALLAGTPVVECETCPLGFDFLEVSGQGSGSADFSHTLMLTGLLPTDALGNPISNPVFRSSSGTQYSVNGVVPEPGSLLLLGTGLALGARRWRRHTRSSGNVFDRYSRSGGVRLAD